MRQSNDESITHQHAYKNQDYSDYSKSNTTAEESSADSVWETNEEEDTSIANEHYVKMLKE